MSQPYRVLCAARRLHVNWHRVDQFEGLWVILVNDKGFKTKELIVRILLDNLAYVYITCWNLINPAPFESSSIMNSFRPGQAQSAHANNQEANPYLGDKQQHVLNDLDTRATRYVECTAMKCPNIICGTLATRKPAPFVMVTHEYLPHENRACRWVM